MKITVVIGATCPEKSKKVAEIVASRPALDACGDHETNDPFWLLSLVMKAYNLGKKVLVFDEATSPAAILRSAVLLPSVLDIVIAARHESGLGVYRAFIDIVSGANPVRDTVNYFQKALDVESARQKEIKKGMPFDFMAGMYKCLRDDLLMKEASEPNKAAKKSIAGYEAGQAATKKYMLGEAWGIAIPNPKVFIAFDPACRGSKAPEASVKYMSGLDNKLYRFVKDNDPHGDCQKCAFKSSDPNCTLQEGDCLDNKGYWVLVDKKEGGNK
jgi:hypothetical protein